MNYPYSLLPQTWQWVLYALYGAAMLAVLIKTPWRRLLDNENSHVFLGSCVGLTVMWLIKADGIPGMDYHYLGATLLTLMVGWRLAIIGMSLVLTGMVYDGMSDWHNFPINALLMGVLPVVISQLIHYFVQKKLPNNFFVYIFLTAFFGAGIAVAMSILAASGLLLASGVHALRILALKYLPYTPLMMFPEAFITGMLITMFVALRPNWVVTFDDDRYINGK